MKNFQITSQEDGKKYWISRSCAVAAFIFVKDKEDNLYILANKRGPGNPDFQGYWNCPCGYIDFDETGEEAALREVYEETGYVLSIGTLKIFYVNTNPSSNKQNIVLSYTHIYDLDSINFKAREGCEKDEVEEVELIDLAKIKNYKWAFDHYNIIKRALSRLNYGYYLRYFKLRKLKK